jgi:uncharacterized protein YbjQ (UPF0145 family)
VTSGPPDEADQKAYEQRSWAELEAGRLPLRAQERLATMQADHAFTSDLTTAEHHAVRSVGFVPVGQVMGASVFQIGYTGGWDCGVRYGYGAGYRGGFGGGIPGGRGGFGGGFGGGGYNNGGFSGMGMGQSLTGVDTVEVTPWRRALQDAQRRAVGRLEQEARALGGDGIVAVRFQESNVANGAVEFSVIGTAVRAAVGPHPPTLFTSDLSGQDFARLVTAGYVPTALLFGIAVQTRHDDWATRANKASWSNVELEGYTRLSTDTRAAARMSLARAAASSGAEMVVLSSHQDRVSEHECRLVEQARDHVMRTTFLGTAIAVVPRHRRTAEHEPPPLPILRLRDRASSFVETTR